VGLPWLGATCSGDGGTTSVSATVVVDRLLDDDGNFGAENVLDAVEIIESCEFDGSGFVAAGMVGMW
jgi:hypothetical protein